DFEEGELGKVPTGWFFSPVSRNAGFSAQITEENPKSGKRCFLMDGGKLQNPNSPGILLQTFDAAAFRGKRVRYRAAVKAQVSGFRNQAQLWMRVDRKGGQGGFFDNMFDRPITANRWRDYDIVGDVADDAEQIVIGLLFFGKGKAWLDAVSFQVIGPSGLGNEAPRALQGRELDNLVACTRLLGYIRYFHPADAAAGADWGKVAMESIGACQRAKSPEELAQILQTFFQPLAPTVRVFPTGKSSELPKELELAKDDSNLKTVSWLHFGVGMGDSNSI